MILRGARWKGSKLKQLAVRCLRKDRIGAEHRLTLKFFLRYTCQFHDRPLQASFEILIPVNGNSDSQVASLTDIDVVATGYTSQTPSFSIKHMLKKKSECGKMFGTGCSLGLSNS